MIGLLLACPSFSPALSVRPALQRSAAARVAQLPRVATPPLMMADAAAEEDGMMETLKTGSFFALWYLFNIGYNIYNKKALNALPIPYTLATLQLAVGVPYVFFLWMTGLRKAPKLSADNVKTLIPVSLGHLGTHIGAVVMLGAIYPPVTYLTLLTIVGGVALASLKELSFTWLGFIAAMISNLSSALRGILAKKTMGGGVGENMTEANIYAVLTVLATIFILPITLVLEP